MTKLTKSVHVVACAAKILGVALVLLVVGCATQHSRMNEDGANRQKTVKVGMNEADVEEILGSVHDVNMHGPGQVDWYYFPSDIRVSFDENGKVTDVGRVNATSD